MDLPWLCLAFAFLEGEPQVEGLREQGSTVAGAAWWLGFACLGALLLWAIGRRRKLAARSERESAANAELLRMLQRTEARYRAAIEASSCVFWVTDPKGHVQAPASTLCEFTGEDAASVVEFGWVNAVHEHDRPGVLSEWQLGLESARAFEVEARIFSARHAGHRAYFMRAAPVRNEAGTLLEWVVTLQDVDDRRQSERERREIERRAQESQRMESLGVLAGGIAHDFNNLLVGVMGHAEWLSRRLDEHSPLQDNLQRIVGAAERAALLCKQMLAFAGRGRFLVEPCNVSSLAREVQGTLLGLIPAGTKFSVRAQAGLSPVEADPAELRQVLISLVTNSAEAFEEGLPGSIAVSIGSRHFAASDLMRTRLGARCVEGEYVYIEVSDDGPGIPSDVLPRIFDPFFSTKFMGRGLSLAAVLGIARSHRGTVDVISEPGKMTQVRVLLPALRADAPSLRAPSEPCQARGAVLVVDDDAEVRELARLTLEDVGVEVVLASNGQDALDMFSHMRDQIDLVLLDLTMPGVDSATTLRELRAIKPDIRVVLSSGYLAGDAIERMGETGVDGFLQKPWRPSSLVEKLSSLMTTRRPERVRVA